MHSAPCLTMQTLARHAGRPVLSRGVWSPLDEFYCMFLCHPYLDLYVLSVQSANRHVGAMLPVISASLCFFFFLLLFTCVSKTFSGIAKIWHDGISKRFTKVHKVLDFQN